MITKICLQCGKTFEVILSRKNTTKFCSRKCYWKFLKRNSCGRNNPNWKGKIKIKCLECKKEFWIYPYQQNNKKFCSQKCRYTFAIGKTLSCKGKKRPQFSGKNCSKWKGGIKQDIQGYIHIYMPEHPFSNLKYIIAHRLLAETYLGRFLDPKEVIHHINGITDDNRPENLYLFSNLAKHTQYHFIKNKPILKSNLSQTS